MEEKAIEILKSIKEGKPFCLLKDENALGESLYEEHVFYIPEKDYFVIQSIDWEKVIVKGIVYASKFTREKERDILPLIETKLESTNDKS